MLAKSLYTVFGMLGVGVLLSTAGCANRSEAPPPGPLDTPVDAFEAVGEPQRSDGTASRRTDSLSTDIEWSQNAREAHRHDQERRRIERQRAQRACRDRRGSREVPIEDGSGDAEATYCQPADEAAP